MELSPIRLTLNIYEYDIFDKTSPCLSFLRIFILLERGLLDISIPLLIICFSLILFFSFIILLSSVTLSLDDVDKFWINSVLLLFGIKFDNF